jgi:hypothetical protein
LVKGFTLDDERLKNPPVAGSGVPDRFDELLERIRDIRASERRMYLRVREIFAMAADYSPSLAETNQFFRVIQNKLHFAVTGKTAAELILERADHTRPNMGLTTWESSGVQKADVSVAKNYLAEEEYAKFAARRRALLEAEGAEHNVKMLEQAAQALPKPERKRTD